MNTNHACITCALQYVQEEQHNTTISGLLQNLTNDVQEAQCWKAMRQEQPEKICSLSVKDAESVYEESRDRTANVMTRWTRTEPREQRNGQREGNTFPNPNGSRGAAHVVSQALQLTNWVQNATEV